MVLVNICNPILLSTDMRHQHHTVGVGMFSPGRVWAPGEARLASSLQSPVSPPVITIMWLTSAQLSSLLYWDNPRDSGIVCGSGLVCLLAVRYISLIRWARLVTVIASPRKPQLLYLQCMALSFSK